MMVKLDWLVPDPDLVGVGGSEEVSGVAGRRREREEGI